MKRDLRIYLLIVVLPAILLVAGGIRLVSLSSERARATALEALEAHAAEAALEIKTQLRNCGFAGEEPKPPRRRERAKNREHRRAHDWAHPRWRPGERICRMHDLPPNAQTAIRTVLEESENILPDCVYEVRHVCGCKVAGTSDAVIRGSIFACADLMPALPGYVVCVAPAGGDAAVALDARSQAIFTAILLLLLIGTLSAGVTLLVRAAHRANAEARAKTDFLSNVSHELKTPLTSIALFSEMLERGTLDPQATQKASAAISRESKRLGRLIDSLLEYARLERSARKYEMAPLDVGQIVEDAASAFAPSFPRGLNAEILMPRDTARPTGDRDATRRIIDCLLENAAKYASAEPVAIRVEEADGRIAVSVVDSGPGIAAADAPHIFKRFWRADNSVTRTTGGAGLGLAIARELAQGMGAELSFRPNSPNGSIFTLSWHT